MNTDAQLVKTMSPLIVLLVLGACAHQPLKIDCDKHLTAINPPTPIVKPVVPAKSGVP